MMPEIIQRWLPSLTTAVAAAIAIGLAVWLLRRWLRRWTQGQAVVRLFRTTLIVVAVVVVALIALRGSGWGAPRLSWSEVSDWVMGPGMRILFIFVGAFLLVRVTDFFIAHLQSVLTAADSGEVTDVRERQKRIDTLGRLLRGLATVVIAGMAGLMALREVAIDITPILTGAGVAGVAIGFGAQTLVKDLIGGIFLIFENQIRVGDVVTINGKTGLVEALRLRIIVLRGQDGAVYIFHNGAVTEYTNLTKDYAYALLDLSVAYKEDVNKVAAVLEAVGEEMQRDAALAGKLRGKLEVLGIESLAGSAVGVRVRVRTLPMEQWNVDRELRRRIKARFEQENIALA